ncbi:MAG TPA: DUF6439 family protein [Vampirovibrionales bacterium]
MANPTPTHGNRTMGLQSPLSDKLQEFSTLELAQALAERLTLTEKDWHRLKSNRAVRAQEQAAAALVFLLKENPEEALLRLHQAVGWIDRSISAPPCPTHGDRSSKLSGQ